MVEEVDEVVAEFLVESYENLDRLDQDLIALEEDPGQPALLATVFRTIHTIKGTCGFLGFSKLEAVTHVGESLLSRLRDRSLELDEDKMSGLLEMVDAVRSMLASIEADGDDGSDDYDQLIARLSALNSPDQVRPASAPPASEAEASAAPVGSKPVSPAPVKRTRKKKVAVEQAGSGESEPDPRPLGLILVESGHLTPDQLKIALAEQSLGDGRKLGEILIDHGAVAPETIEAATKRQADPKPSLAESTIRVDVDVLDRLMNLVGELVLARNKIVQHLGGQADQALQAAVPAARPDHHRVAGKRDEDPDAADRLGLGEVPAGRARRRRVLCASRSGSIMEGEETELDKTIIEAIKDPLTHVVRNAVDHGIESPERATGDRQAGGGHAADARLPRGRPGRSSRSPTTAPGSTSNGQGEGARPWPDHRRAGRADERPGGGPADLPRRLLHRRDRSPTSPAAASGWTWSRPTSRRSAASSTCRARSDVAPRCESRSR